MKESNVAWPWAELMGDTPLDEHFKRRPTAAVRRRQDDLMEDHVADNFATLRATAAMMGCHNSTVYRRLEGRNGRRRDEVGHVWIYNKAVSLERANAARKLKREEERRYADAQLDRFHGTGRSGEPPATEG